MGNDSIALITSFSDWLLRDNNTVDLALIVVFLAAIYYTIHLIK
jgi:hypothetical protein